MNEVVLAIAMLTAPVGTPENCHPDDFPALRTAIHAKAVEWEIMDPRETRYVLATHEDFQGDLDLLRKRYESLKDAPRLADCNKLPDRRTVNELVKFNRDFRKHLEERLAWETDRADIIGVTIQETDRLYKHWDAIRDAQCDFYYVSVRREALKRLRDGNHGIGGIGEHDFAIGKMPDFVPTWRFATK